VPLKTWLYDNVSEPGLAHQRVLLFAITYVVFWLGSCGCYTAGGSSSRSEATLRMPPAGPGPPPPGGPAPAVPGAPLPNGRAQSQNHNRAGPLVLTITPNPSIDLLFEAEQLVWEDANRMAMPRRRAGGQGINVLRALAALGGDGVAIALLGGRVGAELEELLRLEGHRLVRICAEGDTRVFVATRERATGRSLLLNSRGPLSTARSGDALVEAADAAIRELAPRWVACCGSVPPGVPTDTYARIGRLARSAGAHLVVDCDGELLTRALAAGCHLLVPNRHEAERLTGLPVRTVAEAAAVAAQLRAGGVDVVCITLGEEGAVAAGEAGCWHAATPPELQGSAVGAGDAFLAAVLSALDHGDPLPEVVRQGAAAGAAALRSEGEDLITREELGRQLGRTVVRQLAGD
jgi:1-phosphofructokinase family hexose kinase